MFHFHEFQEWRDMPITAELLTMLAEYATDEAAKVLRRKGRDYDGDEYSKGILAGIDLTSSWKPEFIPEEDRSPEDALK